MIEAGAMSSARFGDFVALTIDKTIDRENFFITKEGFTMKS
jgi:hypothetical protein